MPRVSVVMPVYNTARFLSEAIESILGQSFGDFEFIAINDGSTDESEKILHAYAERDARIRVVSQENRGVSRSFNRGLELAAGAYLARMDSDDVAVNTRLEQQVVFLDAHPEVAAVSGSLLLVDEEGDPLCRHKPPEEHEQIEQALLAQCIPSGGCIFVHGCSLARTEVLRKVGGCRAEYEPTDDRDLWLRVSEVGRLHNLQTVLLKYRIHGRSISQGRILEQRAQSRRAVLDAYRRRGLPPPETLHYPELSTEADPAEMHLRFARWASANGFYKTGRKHALRALRRQPFGWTAHRVFARAWLGRFAPMVARSMRSVLGRRPSAAPSV